MATKSARKAGYPSLRSAMWLYCLVVLGTAAIVIPLAYSIDVLLPRLMAALVAAAGFTFAAVIIGRLSPVALFGQPPLRSSLVLSLLIGLAIWVPASWIRFTIYIWLNSAVGLLPPPMPSNAPPLSVLFQAAVIIPLCHGFLFWGYIQRAAEGLDRLRAAVLAAALFGLYGLFTAEGALSSVPEMFVVGLLAALAVYYTNSAWPGILVLSGYGAARILLEDTLFTFLGEQFINPFSVRWLLIVAVTAFIAFILFQALRLRAAAPRETTEVRTAPKPLWWIPLAISVVLFLVGAYGELALRLSARPNAPLVTTPRSGAPPVVIPPTATNAPR
jgi:membrane protease YdiL (CAAX protease family)